MNKIIIIGFASLFLVLLQTSFLHELIFFRNYLNLVLVLIVFITFTVNYQTGFIFALVSGLFLDILSPFSFGTMTISLIMTVLIIFIIFKKLISNKSFYSLAMTMIISTFLYYILLLSLTNLFFWLNWNTFSLPLNERFFQIIIGQLIINTVVITIISIISKFAKLQLLSRFLIPNKI